MINITANFTADELKCPCCGACQMDEGFMRKVQVLRDIVGFPLVPVSGYRCRKYNTTLAGAAEQSQHLYGKAVDIRVRHLNSSQRHRLIDAAFSLEFSGIGTGKNQLHLDIREGPTKYWS